MFDLFTKPLFWVVAIITCLLAIFIRSYCRRLTMHRILNGMSQQKYDQVFKTLDSFVCKSFFTAIDRERLRLDTYVLMANADKIREQFNLMLNMRISKKEKADIYVKAFYFFLDERDYRRAKEMVGKMKGYVDETTHSQCKLICDIVADRSTAYINILEESLKGREAGYDRGMFHYLLGLSYGNLGNKKEQIEHLRIAKKDMKDTPYEVRINKILKNL
ncbi:MAG: hypothetical protein UIM26_06215 [Longicatena sp.]|nr:hypothetical protein [Longicatena sp.]